MSQDHQLHPFLIGSKVEDAQGKPLVLLRGAQPAQPEPTQDSTEPSLSHSEMIVALQNLLSSERETCAKAADDQWVRDPNVSGGDAIRAMPAAHHVPSRDAADQETIAKALHLEASQISAFMYAGAIQCNLERWEGHVGFVANCAEVSLDIAAFLKENADTENPGVIAYELFEPFGKWMAEEGHLPLKNSLLDEFKQQYHAWIKQGQSSIPRESAS